MDQKVRLRVYRRLDNRFEGLSDDSPRALELHNRRKGALHDVLDSQNGIEVVDWGFTDDSKPHEFVELILGAVGVAAFQYEHLSYIMAYNRASISPDNRGESPTHTTAFKSILGKRCARDYREET